jgi:hypothetical protein
VEDNDDVIMAGLNAVELNDLNDASARNAYNHVFDVSRFPVFDTFSCDELL